MMSSCRLHIHTVLVFEWMRPISLTVRISFVSEHSCALKYDQVIPSDGLDESFSIRLRFKDCVARECSFISWGMLQQAAVKA